MILDTRVCFEWEEIQVKGIGFCRWLIHGFRPFFAGTVRHYCSLRYQCCRCMWCYTIGLPGFTLAAGDMNHNHLKKIKVCFNVTSFAWSNYHRITWTLRRSDKSRHRYRSSLISFFIVGGWNGYFFLNYRGCVCFLGITTPKPGLFYLSQLSHLQNLPDDRCLQRSHTYHRGLMGQNSVEDLGAETWVKLEIPIVFSIFLGLLFKTIVGWFSFILFHPSGFHLLWVCSLYQVVEQVSGFLGWYILRFGSWVIYDSSKIFRDISKFQRLFHKNYRHISDHILDM